MNQEQLDDLRARILGDIMPLAVSTSDGLDKFEVILRIIQSGRATPELFEQAYQSAKSLQDEQGRLGALMDLLDEVEMYTPSDNNTSEVSTEE